MLALIGYVAVHFFLQNQDCFASASVPGGQWAQTASPLPPAAPSSSAAVPNSHVLGNPSLKLP